MTALYILFLWLTILRRLFKTLHLSSFNIICTVLLVLLSLCAVNIMIGLSFYVVHIRWRKIKLKIQIYLLDNMSYHSIYTMWICVSQNKSICRKTEKLQVHQELPSGNAVGAQANAEKTKQYARLCHCGSWEESSFLGRIAIRSCRNLRIFAPYSKIIN
jgi:hypothetical protein